MDFYMLDPGGLALQRCYFSDLNVVYPQVHDIRVVIITQDLYSQFYSYIFLHLLHVQHSNFN